MAAVKKRSEERDIKALAGLWLMVILLLGLLGRPDAAAKRDGLRERLSLLSRWQYTSSTLLALVCIATLCGVSVFMLPVCWVKGLRLTLLGHDGPPALMHLPLLLMPADRRSSRLGDLQEEYYTLADTQGRSRAARYVMKQAWLSA